MKKKKYLMKIFMHLHAPLKERIQMVKDLGLNVKSFYMGGGTPTTLSASHRGSNRRTRRSLRHYSGI